MEDFKIVIDNLENFINSGLENKIAEALEKACLLVETDAKRNCPVDDGQLRQSITHKVDIENMEGIIGTSVEYAPYVEIGTGIYSSEGTGRKTAWMYKDEKSGEWHRTRGSKPKPYLQPAMEENKSKIQDLFKGII